MNRAENFSTFQYTVQMPSKQQQQKRKEKSAFLSERKCSARQRFINLAKEPFDMVQAILVDCSLFLTLHTKTKIDSTACSPT